MKSNHRGHPGLRSWADDTDQCGQNQLVMAFFWLAVAAGCFIALAWVCTR